MKLFNTLTNQKEEFKPLKDKKVGLYTCGPTVYDVAHIGNLRKYICDDLLYRTLVNSSFDVTHVMNITDVDDKTIKRSGGVRASFKELTAEYEKSFFADLTRLDIIEPQVVTRATEYIEKMVSLVEDLLNKGYAYKADDGSVYFSIAKFADYGKLSKLDKEGIRAGARVAQDEYDKENPSDFALWKAWDESDGEIFWETSLGKGRPGWHIECSAMSMDVLGETIDIHTGGVDNIFPHHENEIAQSEAKTGKKFVNYWVHNEHLLVDGKKMSKSLGNFYRLNDLIERGFMPLDFRYFVLGAHYRSKLNFTWEGLEGARNARLRLSRLVLDWVGAGTAGKIGGTYYDQFMTAVKDDINMPLALAAVWAMARDEAVAPADKLANILEFEKILGLELAESEEIPENVLKIADERKKARDEKDFAKSDELRAKIEQLGFIIEDKAEGYEIRVK